MPDNRSSPPPHEPLLRPGINFTTRAEMKFARAVHLANELRGRVDEWSTSETLLAELKQVDDHTAEYRMIVRAPAPVDEWSLILGDVVHNLRSVLDVVTWGLANLDGQVPARPAQVSFPLTRDEADWQQRIKTLESIPSVYRERLRSIQPWAEGVAREESTFGLLHEMDILDKHRGLISGKVRIGNVYLGNLQLNLEPDDEAGYESLTAQMQKTPVVAQDGTVILTFHHPSSVMRPAVGHVAKVDVSFALDVGSAKEVFLSGFLNEVISTLRESLDRLYGGDLFAKQLKSARLQRGASLITAYQDEDGVARVLEVGFSDA